MGAAGLALVGAVVVVSVGLYAALAVPGAVVISAYVVSLAIGVSALDLFALRSDLAASAQR